MDQSATTIWYLLAIILVASNLFSRRLPIHSVLRLALLWVAIFAVLFAAFKWAEKEGYLNEQDFQSSISASAVPASKVEGGALKIPLANDGHYWVEAQINGKSFLFLIDSGATITAISANAAKEAGLSVDPNSSTVTMMTANGKVDAQRSNLSSFEIGPIRVNDLPVVISSSFGDVNVIGMNFLSHLSKWGVEDKFMILQP